MKIWPWSAIRRLTDQAKYMKWLVRAAFECGYRSAKPDTQKDEWRPSWRASMPRDKLVKMGHIKENDIWR